MGFKFKKFSLVGAGNIGGHLASIISNKNLCDEILVVDIFEGIAKGKALDLAQSNTLIDSSTKFSGTKDLSKIHDSDVIIPTNALVLAQDIVSTTEVQYSQAERMLHALELDVAEAVSHTTNTISLNALTSSEGIAGDDIDTNTVNTTSTTNSNRREIDAHAMVLGAVEKENRYLRGQRAQELIDSKTASSSLFLDFRAPRQRL